MLKLTLLCLPFLTFIPAYPMQTPQALISEIKKSVIATEKTIQSIDALTDSSDSKNRQAVHQLLEIEEGCRKLRLILSGSSWVTEKSEK